MFCLPQVWQPLKEKINFGGFFFLDKHFVFSYSEARGWGWHSSPSSRSYAKMHVCWQSRTSAACSSTKVLTLNCTSQNLLTYIFTLSTWINSRSNVLVIAQVPAHVQSLHLHSSCGVVLNRLFQKVVSDRAGYPVNKTGQQCCLVPEFSKRDLLQQAEGALLSNISGLKARLCWTKHPAYQFDLVPAVVPKSWHTCRLCYRSDCKKRVISETHWSNSVIAYGVDVSVSFGCGSSGW